MFTTTNSGSAKAARKNREAVALDEIKRQLGYRADPTRDRSANGGFDEAAIHAFLMRFLRAKNLSSSEAIAKLKRRRAFEGTLPTISVTPAVVSLLRCGAFSAPGNDNRGRPILFLHLRDLSLPPMEVDEAQRILIILLEFMQSKCLAASAADGGDAIDADVEPAAEGTGAAGVSSSLPYSTAGANTSTAVRSQSFTLLIDADGAPWSAYLPLMRKATTLYSIFSKYYPGLVDQVLIAEASFEVRRGVQAALAGSRPEVSRQVLMVQRGDLSRYMAPTVTPTSLGGALEISGNALSFAEAVLRHWYTVTSYLQLENNLAGKNAAAGGASATAGAGTYAPPRPRPLYQPTPLMTSAEHFASLRRSAAMSASTAIAARPPSSAPLSAGHAMGSMSVSGGGGDLLSQLSNSRQGTGGGQLEDGVCSELSADDATLMDSDKDEDDTGAAAAAAGTAFTSRTAGPRAPEPASAGTLSVARPLEAEEAARVRSDPAYAVAALEEERGLRTRAEQLLKIAQLGVTLDPRSISATEKQLAAIHRELNVLVADVAVKARVARRQQAEATVDQLLDLTLTALEAAANTPEEVPAMSLAVPQQREPESSTCCSVM